MRIGLSIARSVMPAHAGRILAENETKGGAIFHLSSPLSAG